MLGSGGLAVFSLSASISGALIFDLFLPNIFFAPLMNFPALPGEEGDPGAALPFFVCISGLAGTGGRSDWSCSDVEGERRYPFVETGEAGSSFSEDLLKGLASLAFKEGETRLKVSPNLRLSAAGDDGDA
jgi:hypothetical protein